MPSDDRERNFEKALARNLQPGAATPGPAPHSASAQDCPDAEILAAYHERLLTPEEMISRKQHIAACARCQEIFAQLEATDEIPLEADQQELVSQAATSAHPMHLVRAASASLSAQEVVVKSAAPLEMTRRSANWRWLAPAGALAAVLMVWVAIHERAATEFNLAKNHSELAPPISPAPSASASQSLSREEPAWKDSSAQPAARVAAPEKTDALVNEERGALKQRVLPPSSLPKLTAPAGSPRPDNSNLASRGARAQSRILEQSSNADKERRARDAEPQPSGASTTTTTESPINAVTPARAPAILEPSRAKKAGTATGVAAAPTLDQIARTDAFAQLQNVNSQIARNSVLVSSPDGTVTWRLASTGIVQRSDDGGSNWMLQKTAVITDLLAGSAPTNKVCWIVGRTGTILRTIDGGKHWRKTSSPTAEDIASVFAIDAQQASVTTTTRNSYKTPDAGATWIPASNP